MNPKKIARIKREYNIVTKIRKKRAYAIKFQKDLSHRVAPNVLSRNFKVDAPDTVYCTDITYLFYNGGVGYLSATKDVATREIVAYNISGNMGIDTGLDSLSRLLSERELKGVMIHSDQGVHYTHPAYVGLLARHGIVQSMSRKGAALDNAPIESFFGHMKDEIEVKNCRNMAELRKEIDKYVKYYNTERGQWELKRMPPIKYREHLLSNPT
jgi:transposase InsO family protein